MKNEILPEEKLLNIIKNADPFENKAEITPVKTREEISPALPVFSASDTKKQNILILTVILCILAGVFFFQKSSVISVETVARKEEPVMLTKSVKTVDPPQNLVLLGVIDAEVPSVIVEVRDTGRVYTLETGDELSGFRLVHIESGQAVFENPDEKFTIKL